MKKIIVALSLFSLVGFLSQPVLAQCVDSASEIRPHINNCSPVATPIKCPCGCQNVTGGAASLQSIQPTIQPVKIPKKHWFNFTRTGYRAVYPSATGYAVQLQQSSCGCGMTTGAAAAIPIVSCNQNVLVPKRHFWEHDKIQVMNVSPSTITGFAVPVYQPTVCPAAPIEQPQCQPLPKTGGAAPVKKKPVRGYW
jgi:hypothetical protein